MKEEILKAYSHAQIELQEGSGGNFIVDVDGKVVFSKNDDDKLRFPLENEVVELMKKAGF